MTTILITDRVYKPFATPAAQCRAGRRPRGGGASPLRHAGVSPLPSGRTLEPQTAPGQDHPSADLGWQLIPPKTFGLEGYSQPCPKLSGSSSAVPLSTAVPLRSDVQARRGEKKLFMPLGSKTLT